MAHDSSAHLQLAADRPNPGSRITGLLLTLLIALSSIWVATTPLASELGLGALTLAIVLGILIGNSLPETTVAGCEPGIAFAAGTLLRLGIILYGFHISVQQLATVGWHGLMAGAMVVTSTFLLAWWAGTRLFRLDRQTAMLIGAGSAICGAAAVMAAAPVIRAPAHKVSVAVATVVLFGTIGMFLYPLAYPLLGFSEQVYGMVAGATIHEVAQVVAAGGAVGPLAADTAVLVKMLRVIMLVPFLLLLSYGWRRQKNPTSAGHEAAITIPWFALLFLGAIGFNSLHALPGQVVEWLLKLDMLLLAMAMAALGLRTNFAAIRHAGRRPVLLALVLFVFLLGSACLLGMAAAV